MRRRTFRVVIAVGLLVALFGLPGVADHAITSQFRMGDPYERRFLLDSLGLVVRLAPPLLLIPFLGRVAYRKRDGLLFLIPVYGFVFGCKICWRLAALPHRDWPPRPTPRPTGPPGGITGANYGSQSHQRSSDWASGLDA